MLFGYSTSIEAGDDLKEMKNSGIEWIGEIPADWKTIKSKYCICISNGSDPKTEGSTPVYGSGAESFKTCGEYKIGPAVLLGRKGATLHIPHYIEGNYWNVDTAFDATHFCGNINLKFYYYCACVFDYAGYISQTTLPGMTQTNYKNMSIPFPQLEVQERIAIFLDEKCSQIDAIITRQQEVIEKLKAYKLSVITEAVTKGLNPDVPMKDSGVEWIGQIPEHWTASVLRYGLENIQTGPFGSQLHAEDYIEDGIFVINPANIVEGRIVPDNRCSVTESKALELSRHILNKGDIVFARRGEMGRCAYFAGDSQQYLCGTGCIKIQCNSTLLPEYIAWFLQTSCVKQYLTLNSVGTTMANLNTMIISGIPVLFPPKCEQEEIVQYIKRRINEIDLVVKNKERMVVKLSDYKKSLIYEMVTGKKEV